MKIFKAGQIVKHKLTGEKLIILNQDASQIKAIKDFISNLLKEEKEKEFNEGEKSMARGVLRRIENGNNIGHIELLCRAVADKFKKLKE